MRSQRRVGTAALRVAASGEVAMLWPQDILDTIDATVAAARCGRTVVLDVEGEAGLGKSTLLGAVADRLGGFRVLRAFGEQSGQDERFQVLQEWGALAPGADPPRNTLQAVRLLAPVIDSAADGAAPVAIVLDDLQWIDPESVETLTALVRRAVGDRLVVVGTHRPLGAQHPSWCRVTETSIRLRGLDTEQAARLVADLAPDAPARLAEQLRRHTGGSPLLMRSLLQEHFSGTLAALADRDALPAPYDLAAAVDARMAELAPEAARLLRALAVLDDGWTELSTAAAVAGVRDPASAVALLGEAGLLRTDAAADTTRIRLFHSVVRAAVADVLDAEVRRRLHGAAAARVTDRGARLRHRYAAALGPDEGLACDLERHADALHNDAHYREAARYRRLSAEAGRAAETRRRSLDAQVDAVLAHEHHDAAPTGTQTPHERVVTALRMSAAKQWVRAAEVLDGLTEADLERLDARNRYRALVLRGWTTIGAGRPAADALSPLQRADECQVQDPAFQGIRTFAYGQALQPVTTPGDDMWGFHDSLDADRATLATTADGRLRLAWRGAVSALTGATTRAVDDLTVVTRLVDEGQVDLGDGAFHALLALSQWSAGEWRRAAMSLELATTAPRDVPHPLVAAIAPVAALVTGADLDEALTHSRQARLSAPLPSAVQAGDVADVAALGYAGTPSQRRAWRGSRTADFGDPRANVGRAPYLWLLTMGLSAAWEDDAAAVDAWADHLAELSGGTWRTGAVAWLRALARRARGEPAADDLATTARNGLAGLPSFEALLWVDAARTAAREGSSGAADVRNSANWALRDVGADRYAETLLPSPPTDTQTEPTPDDPLTALSDREKEVATLVLDGLSYAQIAQELYVTRSTVAFHLSNIYAKTATASRHELVDLMRPARRRTAGTRQG